MNILNMFARLTYQPHGNHPQYKLWHKQQMQKVECLNYFDSLITSDPRCTLEIKSRIATAKAASN
jgi:hypothetical protein